MKKLNFGCGTRYSKDWINIDFNSNTPEVISCNLLQPLPFADNTLDVVYSSHVLEHFSREAGTKVLSECFRILKPGGIIRIVIPDLEYTCREYIRLLDSIESQESQQQYEWVVIELLDQLVRTEPGGLMKAYWQKIAHNNNQSAINYVETRMGGEFYNEVKPESKSRSLTQKLLDVNATKLRNKFTYLYIDTMKKLLPRSLRESVVDNTILGEKHKWMYDRYGLSTTFKQIGFTDIQFLGASTSAIPGFEKEHLDTTHNGTVYKPGSLYCEAIKPSVF